MRKHTFTKKYPLGAIVVLLLIALLLSEAFVPLLNATGMFGSGDLASNISSIIGAVLFLLGMKAWYSPQYKGVLMPGLSMPETLFVTLPLILYSLIVMIIQLIQFHGYFNPSISNIVRAITAGFGEEVLYRVTIIPVAMGFLKSEKRVWGIPLVTALIFGGMHVFNIFSGASVTNGVVQAVVTAMMGFYYGVLFVATGSAFPGIMMHGIYDFICFAGDASLTEGIMTTTLAPWEIILNLILALAMLLSAIVILKKIGSDRILRIWKDKWSQE